MAAHDAEDYFVPLTDQRVFGAGIKRKRVAFVPSAGPDVTASATQPSDVGSTYLSIVLDKKNGTKDDKMAASDVLQHQVPSICSVCGQVLNDSPTQSHHKSSIAHQICLEHSYPPSHLDRDRIGLKFLQMHGWDPDARAGLGARQEGIRIPIKSKEKKDTAGLGLNSRDDEDRPSQRRDKKLVVEEKRTILNAKQIRELEIHKRRKAERLQQLMYGEDLSPYLGPDG